MNINQLRCSCCQREELDPRLVPMLIKLEARGGPRIYTSGFRCEKRQKELVDVWDRERIEWDAKHPGEKFPKAKPAQHGQHVLGKAADVAVKDEADRDLVVALAREIGFTGIGIGSNFVHLDLREIPVEWKY